MNQNAISRINSREILLYLILKHGRPDDRPLGRSAVMAIALREVRSRELWQSIPLDLAMSVMAILLAAGLKFFGWIL